MKFIISILSILGFAYLLLLALLYLFQRSLLYYPVASSDIRSQPISFDNQGLLLHGWVLNQGQPKALIYFGGNAEVISDNVPLFESIFPAHTIYLINYRGYGDSEGEPSEQALFSDALVIYDQIRTLHQSVSLMGRSLGSGVAIYLATQRSVNQLFLITPYDSIAELAQTHYPLFPTRYLVKDSFDSASLAANIVAPVLILGAQFDQVVPLKHTKKLKDALINTDVIYRTIEGSEHNNITDFPQYRQAIAEFLRSEG